MPGRKQKESRSSWTSGLPVLPPSGAAGEGQELWTPPEMRQAGGSLDRTSEGRDVVWVLRKSPLPSGPLSPADSGQIMAIRDSLAMMMRLWVSRENVFP